MTMQFIASSSVSGQTTVSFSNIAQSFTHLQIRAFLNNANISVAMTFNGDSATNYADHILYGDGASVVSTAVAPKTHISFTQYSASATNVFQVSIIDILDYANINKFKTVRSITGSDANGSGSVALSSGLWRNTNAITSITFGVAGGSWTAGSRFDLYGITTSEVTGA
jgi:hypothetical protein